DFERAVSAAMRSPLVVGGARFHVGGQAGPAETVFLGAFRRDWLRRVGGYDTSYARAQDWEMNWRIRQLGGVVWFTPELTVTYRPRPDLRALARQYFRTGQWRRRLVQQHPESVNARYLAPPVAVVTVAAATVGGLAWRPLWLVPLRYVTAIAVRGMAVGAEHGPRVAAPVPAVLAAMHLASGAGGLRGRGRDAAPPGPETGRPGTRGAGPGGCVWCGQARAMMSFGCVFSWTFSGVAPSAASRSTSPSSVTSMTAVSLMMRCTTPSPVI